jgi:hypothetical protein
MTKQGRFFLISLLCISILLGGKGLCQEAPSSAAEKPVLAQASMCASLKEGSPCNPGVAFPVSQGRVICFSSFDPVPKKTSIFHSWYHRDVLITRQKLILNPPRWSTYSTIQLRESDKGPWRVELTDQDGRILEVLRFSITD